MDRGYGKATKGGDLMEKKLSESGLKSLEILEQSWIVVGKFTKDKGNFTHDQKIGLMQVLVQVNMISEFGQILTDIRRK